MREFLQKIKPSRGFSHIIYIVLNIALPLLVLVLVKTSFVWPAIAIIMISKWRMFAVRPRFWLANIRTNAIDIIFGLSMLGFMIVSPNSWFQIGFAAVWALWLIFIKPRMSVLWVSLQAMLGFVAGLMALFALWPRAPLVALVATVGFICFFAAYHFFYSFDEPHALLLAYLWAYFGSALTWILGHWLIFYWIIAQVTLLLVSLSFVLGTLYYLDHFDKLSVLVRRQIIFIGIATVLIIWSALVYFHWIHGSSIVV